MNTNNLTKELPQDEILICMDESNKQHIEETKIPIPMKPGEPLKYDYEYKRNGVSAHNAPSGHLCRLRSDSLRVDIFYGVILSQVSE